MATPAAKEPTPTPAPQETVTPDEEPRYHVWYYRKNSTAKPQTFEFAMKCTKREAADRIAAQVGVPELPEDAAVTHEAPKEPVPENP